MLKKLICNLVKSLNSAGVLVCWCAGVLMCWYAAQLCQQGTVRNDHLTTPCNVLGGYWTNQGLWKSLRLFVK